MLNACFESDSKIGCTYEGRETLSEKASKEKNSQFPLRKRTDVPSEVEGNEVFCQKTLNFNEETTINTKTKLNETESPQKNSTQPLICKKNKPINKYFIFCL